MKGNVYIIKNSLLNFSDSDPTDLCRHVHSRKIIKDAETIV